MTTTIRNWRPDQQALWQSLRDFALDLPDSSLSFSQRVARENAWRQSFAQRVIDEYRRFLFLAMHAGHVVCPSDAVDQVWHMHLTYTRSYWDELCKQVLKRPLHHGPTKGGSKENEKHYLLYQRTLDSYQEWFGERPPDDIWPNVEKRFGEDLRNVRVNLNRNWVIPRPRWTRALVGSASAGMLIPIAQLAGNPLDWTGVQFLTLFFGLLIVAVVFCLIARIWTVRSEPAGAGAKRADGDEIGPIEAAWLEGGDHHALSCAVIDLAQRNAISLSGSTMIAGASIQQCVAPHRLSQLVLESISASNVGRSWRAISRDVQSGMLAMRQALEDRGLATDWSTRAAAVAVPIATIGGLMFFGMAKMWVGYNRGRPIAILTVGELLAAVILFIFLANVPKVTSSGRVLLRQLKEKTRQMPEATGDENASGGIENNRLLWSAALLGTGVLAATQFSHFGSYFRQQRSAAASSSGCGTSGCGGDSGGGCGGCGGCGGD